MIPHAYDISKRNVISLFICSTLIGLMSVTIAMIEGCAVFPYIKPLESTKYDVSRKLENLDIDMSIVDKLPDDNPVLNISFRERGILAMNVRLKNNGNDDIEFFTRDMVIELDSGERIPALQQTGTYSLFGNKFYDSAIYKSYGLPAKRIEIKPKGEKHGLLFFRVEDKYEKATSGKFTIQYSRITAQNYQYKINLRSSEID